MPYRAAKAGHGEMEERYRVEFASGDDVCTSRDYVMEILHIYTVPTPETVRDKRGIPLSH
jgi:hypothetical protein